MESSDPSARPAGAGSVGEPVVVWVPAEAEFVGILRRVAASVAAVADQPIDAIDDVRMAVDEACSLLLGVTTGPPARIEMRVRHLSDFLEVAISVDAGAGRWPPDPARDSLSSRLLAALADGVRFERDDARRRVVLRKNVSIAPRRR